VVINFVQPPAPKPGTINVIKYTCGAGFEGAYYADFLATAPPVAADQQRLVPGDRAERLDQDHGHRAASRAR
jgi:hypothetical protein